MYMIKRKFEEILLMFNDDFVKEFYRIERLNMENKKPMNIYDIEGFLFIKVDVREAQIHFLAYYPLANYLLRKITS